MTEETYRVDVLCCNCSNIVWFNIPKGTTTKDYLDKNILCPRCGCEHGRVKWA